MSSRPDLSRRVPRPRAALSAVADVMPETTAAIEPPTAVVAQPLKAVDVAHDAQPLRDRLAELEAAKEAAEERAAKASEQARVAQRRAAELEKKAPAIERSYAGTMSRPHTKADGMTYRRTTLSLPETMDKAIDFYVKSSGGRFRNRSAFLKAATEAFFKDNALPEKGTPVDAYLDAIKAG